ncbi:MAG: SGNH/GDSL hydrolase family protein [Xylophilus ampelinus]
MTANWSRRAFLATAGASAAASVLTACGSSTVESAIRPSRFIAFGDALSDLGQNGTRYTVNDGSVNIWSQQLASRYGVALTTASAGGTSYAVGNARITGTPDAAGIAATPTVTQQIGGFLAANAFKDGDVVIAQGGTSDVIYNYRQFAAGAITAAQLTANLTQAGTEFGAQVRRLVTAGAKYVVVVGTYNMGRSPWATSVNDGARITEVAAAFNTALLLAITDLGTNVLYVDATYYYNLLINAPGSYSLTNSTTVVCTSTDAADGIGIGAGNTSSARCTPSTIGSGLAYDSYLFADPVYFTPAANRLFGNYAYDRLARRF